MSINGQIYTGNSLPTIGDATINSGGTLQVPYLGRMFANLNQNAFNAVNVNPGGSLVLYSWSWNDNLGTLFFQYQERRGQRGHDLDHRPNQCY